MDFDNKRALVHFRCFNILIVIFPLFDLDKTEVFELFFFSFFRGEEMNHFLFSCFKY